MRLFGSDILSESRVPLNLRQRGVRYIAFSVSLINRPNQTESAVFEFSVFHRIPYFRLSTKSVTLVWIT